MPQQSDLSRHPLRTGDSQPAQQRDGYATNDHSILAQTLTSPASSMDLTDPKKREKTKREILSTSARLFRDIASTRKQVDQLTRFPPPSTTSQELAKMSLRINSIEIVPYQHTDVDKNPNELSYDPNSQAWYKLVQVMDELDKTISNHGETAGKLKDYIAVIEQVKKKAEQLRRMNDLLKSTTQKPDLKTENRRVRDVRIAQIEEDIAKLETRVSGKQKILQGYRKLRYPVLNTKFAETHRWIEESLPSHVDHQNIVESPSTSKERMVTKPAWFDQEEH